MIYKLLGNTGIQISHVSLGGAAFSNIYGKYDEEESVNFIRYTLEKGINYLETSPWYGQGSSERTIGKALKGIPRNSYFVGSKVGRYELKAKNMFDFSAEKTQFALDNTLNLLGLDYVDLIQIHDVTFAPDKSIILKETLPTLLKAVNEGKANYIGIADYDIELMKEIVEESEVKISTILSYGKSTLLDNRLQNYTKYFKNKGIGVINAATTGMGLLTNDGPRPWHPASEEIKSICIQASEYCKEKGVELARLANWFSLNQPDIDTNICGFLNKNQLKDTLDVIDNGLTKFEKSILTDLQQRFFNNCPMHWDSVELYAHKKKLLEA